MSQQAETSKEMPFLEHLEELRWHLIRSVVAVLVITVVVFAAKSFVFGYFIVAPTIENFITFDLFCKLSHSIGIGDLLCFQSTGAELVSIKPSGKFIIHLKVSVVLGFIAAFPYVLWEIWKFIKPGLHDNEQKNTRGFVFISSILFFTGVAFAYFVLIPFSFNFFASYRLMPDEPILNQFDIGAYVDLFTTLALASGLMFELPLIVFFLSRFGLVTPDLMRKHRKHAVIAILFVAALITPADIWTQVLVTGPVYILYELSIRVSARVEKQLKAREAAEEMEGRMLS